MKTICVIANGYAEEMLASNLMYQLRDQLSQYNDEYRLLGGSLVSSGKWFQEKNFDTFLSGGVTPSGGFPTKSITGFFADLFSGSFGVPFKMAHLLKHHQNSLSMIIVVGDFLLMATAIPAVKKHRVPLIFIPTAKSNYIQAHFNIEKKYIKKYATASYPRDQITAEDFQNYGINSCFLGNMIQDLFPETLPQIQSEKKIVAMLPGSRDEAYKNMEQLLYILENTPNNELIHWAFVRAGSLDKDRFNSVLYNQHWILSEKDGIEYWSKNQLSLAIYPNHFFDAIAGSCHSAISLAGTASEQIVGLSKPVIGFVGSGPQSTKQRMLDNSKLLGDAFLFEQFPHGVIQTLSQILNDSAFYRSIAQTGQKYMGSRGGTLAIAKDILQYLK